MLDKIRTKAAQKGCNEICVWLVEEKLASDLGEGIVDNARWLLADLEKAGKLPSQKAPPNVSVAEIIQRLRPPRSINSEERSVGWFAQWLARWAYFAIPARFVRHKALNLALDKQIRGEAV